MSHDIVKGKDQVVLHQKRAWHGLGIVVEDAPTPREALSICGLDSGVEQRPLLAQLPDGTTIEVPTHVANYHGNTGAFFGIVGANYQVITNGEMADFCEALGEDHVVHCETAGSIQGGKKVWFLLKGEAFEVANNDEIFPYILVSNGHDGMASFRVTPTTVRTVCKNTLQMVVDFDADTGKLDKSSWVMRHTSNVLERVNEARESLKRYNHSLEVTKNVIGVLAAKDVNTEQVQQFFLECYTSDWGEIPTNPQNKVEENRRNRGQNAMSLFSKRFDDEREVAGTSMWNCFNAMSGLLQHDRKARGADDSDRVEKRVDSNLFGLNAWRTSRAFDRAYVLAQ